MTLTSRRHLLLACFALTSTLALSAQTPSRAVVTIVHLNDVYEIGPVEGGRFGGLARVATVLSQLKRTTQPLLVTLGGDYLSPSALGTARVNGESLAGRQMVDVLNATGVQWATLGNHEFDVSEAAFKARMVESKFKIVISNATDAQGKPFANTMTSAIIPVVAGGRTIRLGLIGLVVDDTEKAWVKYLPPIETAQKEIAALAGKVDAIVALTHLRLSDDVALAEAVPEITVILGGHEHENWMARRGAAFTPIIKADANVRSLAIVSMTFGARGTRPAVAARLQVIDSSVKALPAVDAIVKRWTATAFDAFKKDGLFPETPVVTLTEPLDGRETVIRRRPGKLTEIIANAVRTEAKADIGILNAGSVRIDDVLPAGVVTEYDIIRVLPFGGKLQRAVLDGNLLARVLETGLGNAGSGGYLHTSTGSVRTSTGWVINGKPLDPAAKYVVGFTDYLLTGLEANLGFLTKDNPGVHDVTELRDVRRAVIDELKSIYK